MVFFTSGPKCIFCTSASSATKRLALVVAIYRSRQSIDIDMMNSLKG